MFWVYLGVIWCKIILNNTYQCVSKKQVWVKPLPRILKTLPALQIQLNTFMFWFPYYFSTMMSFSPWWYYYWVSNFCLFLTTDLFWVSVSCVVVNVLIFIYDSCSSHPLSHFSVFVLVPLCSPVWDLAKLSIYVSTSALLVISCYFLLWKILCLDYLHQPLVPHSVSNPQLVMCI